MYPQQPSLTSTEIPLKVASYLKEYNIERKITEIRHDYSDEAVEKLDELITAGMMCAEKECRNNV